MSDDLVECLMCHWHYRQLSTHVRRHGIDFREYVRRFPGVENSSVISRKLHSEVQKTANKRDPTIQQRHSKSLSKLYKEDPTVAQRISKEVTRSLLKTHRDDPTFAERTSASLQKLWKDNPEFVEMMSNRFTEEVRRRMSEGSLRAYAEDPTIVLRITKAMQNLWRNPEYVRRMTASRNKHPNLSEERLREVLDEYFPDEWRFVGGGDVSIGGRLPDFANTKGKKVVIEMFGLYYHNPIVYPNRPTEEELVTHYRSYGFACLVFWEDVVWCAETEIVRRVSEVLGV